MKKINRHSILTCTFIICWFIVSFVLFRFEQPLMALVAYGLFSLSSLASFFCKNIKFKEALATLSFVMMFSVGIGFPLDIEVIEEVYLFIPLLYVMTFPGSFKPIFAAFALLTAYFPSVNQAELLDIIEDGTELIVITSFASVMAYFYKKTHQQMTQFRKDSQTDYLTRLSNRNMFMSSLENNIINCSQNKNLNFALIIIDLDGFKKVNDQKGHIVGDQVLKIIANRLNTLTSKQNHIFRIGGDEFAIICNAQDNAKASAINLSKQVLELCKRKCNIDGNSYYLSASIGISIMPEHGNDIESLCTSADMAMYYSKDQGKNQFSLYRSNLAEKALRTYTLENELKIAIKNQQLALYYQPKVDLKTNQIVSAEALLRWQHPELGFISPAEFIPIAERTGLIVPLGEWVIETACKQVKQWQQYDGFLSIAVNISALQLQQDNFVERINAILNTQQCKPEWLELEQTESSLMENTLDNVSILSQLKAAGFTLSLDDFGTAYSSLSQLSLLPLNILKIDKSFIDECTSNAKSHMIVRTIIQLANNLNMQTIAEGVETIEQLALLQSEGCDMFQGYLCSKPLSEANFEKLILPELKFKL